MSAIQNRRVQAGTVVMGDLTIQGNLKGVPSISEPLQVALENGATRAMVPISKQGAICRPSRGDCREAGRDFLWRRRPGRSILKGLRQR
jgi:predicted ATP-dependent serine protease